MQYVSTRGNSVPVSAAQAIMTGIAPDGGLFVPEHIPQLSQADLDSLRGLTYQQRAVRILSPFLPQFSLEEVQECVYGAYNENSFDDIAISPLVRLDNDVFVLELWHGPTCAFKDMALQILPRLMRVSARITGDPAEIVILVATSGDTGKAALEGFRDVDHTRIIVFFPEDGVSDIQKRQMVTQEGANVYVAAVRGNFDDAQTGVKEIFGDAELIQKLADNNMKMSSANSINWGRLLPQIVYYVSAYADLLEHGRVSPGDPVNIVVPTGNFGNILAAYYAGRMGIPVKRLICASNANNVLTDFLTTGVYDRNRQFFKTISPSMDILVSSNLERLLYELTSHDAGLVAGWMRELRDKGGYRVTDEVKKEITSLFWADYCTDEETIEIIRNTWQRFHYLTDTHTAVALGVYQKYVAATQDQTPAIIASTASPFKFGQSVAGAILQPEQVAAAGDEFALLSLLSGETGIPVPAAIAGLKEKTVRHNTVCPVPEMKKTVEDFLGIR